MSLPDLDILEVKSVSDMISVFETPADDAAKLIGEDDVAIFSPQLDLMIVTSQYDLEEPVATSQTVILSVADAECTWLRRVRRAAQPRADGRRGHASRPPLIFGGFPCSCTR